MKFEIIVAMDNNGVIGTSKSAIPWQQKEDQKRFRDMTLGNLVVYGSNTLKTLPFADLGFPNRGNLVITTQDLDVAKFSGQLDSPEFLEACETAIDAQPWINNTKDERIVYIVGGADIYRQALAADIVSRIHLTIVYTEVDTKDCTYHTFPDLDAELSNFDWLDTEYHLGDGDKNQYDFEYQTLVKVN